MSSLPRSRRRRGAFDQGNPRGVTWAGAPARTRASMASVCPPIAAYNSGGPDSPQDLQVGAVAQKDRHRL